MWNYAEYSTMPDSIDSTSSEVYVYVRKDIKEVEKESMGEKTVAYECLEQKILKKDWELYEKLLGHDTELTEIQDALLELATIVSEV